jgi:hypothetical protein
MGWNQAPTCAQSRSTSFTAVTTLIAHVTNRLNEEQLVLVGALKHMRPYFERYRREDHAETEVLDRDFYVNEIFFEDVFMVYDAWEA